MVLARFPAAQRCTCAAVTPASYLIRYPTESSTADGSYTQVVTHLGVFLMEGICNRINVCLASECVSKQVCRLAEACGHQIQHPVSSRICSSSRCDIRGGSRSSAAACVAEMGQPGQQGQQQKMQQLEEQQCHMMTS